MKLYVLATCSIKERKLEDIEKDFNKRYNGGNYTLEDHIKYLKEVHEYDYTFSTEDNAYFFDLEEAKYAAENNCADINDGGCYNYVTIRKVEEGRMYSNCYVEEFYIYKYNKETDIFEDVSSEEDSISELLKYNFSAKFLGKGNYELTLSDEDLIKYHDFVVLLKETLKEKSLKNIEDLFKLVKETQGEDFHDIFLDDIKVVFNLVLEDMDNYINDIKYTQTKRNSNK